MPYVYSTATCPTAYVKYKPPVTTEGNIRASSGHNQILKRVVIQGGHGLATKQFVTPIGIATQVSEDDLEFLLQDENFQRHVKAGYVTYDKKKVDPSKKAANMELKDGSAQLTPKDFEKGDNSDDHLKVYKGIHKDNYV